MFEGFVDKSIATYTTELENGVTTPPIDLYNLRGRTKANFRWKCTQIIHKNMAAKLWQGSMLDISELCCTGSGWSATLNQIGGVGNKKAFWFRTQEDHDAFLSATFNVSIGSYT